MLYLYEVLGHVVPLLTVTSGILGSAVVLHAMRRKNAAAGQDAVDEEKPKEDSVEYTESLLKEFSSASLSEDIADAFIRLMSCGYVTVDKLVNDGCKYSDDRQCQQFKRFLSPSAIEKINNLDGRLI